MTTKFDKVYESFVNATKYDGKKDTVPNVKPGDAAVKDEKNIDRIKVPEAKATVEKEQTIATLPNVKPGDAAFEGEEKLKGEKNQNTKKVTVEDAPAKKDEEKEEDEAEKKTDEVVKEDNEDNNQNTNSSLPEKEKKVADQNKSEEDKQMDEFVATLNKKKFNAIS
jgi:hypothetical protein